MKDGKVDLDELLFQALDFLRARGWDTIEITRQVPYDDMLPLRFRVKTLMLAMVAYKLLADGQPMTLRGLFYRVVSSGWFPSTDKEHYQALGRVMTILREAEVVPFDWIIVDGVRRRSSRPAGLVWPILPRRSGMRTAKTSGRAYLSTSMCSAKKTRWRGSSLP